MNQAKVTLAVAIGHRQAGMVEFESRTIGQAQS
jgi:hypothetical protein